MGQLKRNNFSKQFKRMKYCKLILNGFQHEVNEAKHNWIVSRNGKIQISSYSFCLNFIYSFLRKSASYTIAPRSLVLSLSLNCYF